MNDRKIYQVQVPSTPLLHVLGSPMKEMLRSHRLLLLAFRSPQYRSPPTRCPSRSSHRDRESERDLFMKAQRGSTYIVLLFL